jgi:hypothetical protein
LVYFWRKKFFGKNPVGYIQVKNFEKIFFDLSSLIYV